MKTLYSATDGAQRLEVGPDERPARGPGTPPSTTLDEVCPQPRADQGFRGHGEPAVQHGLRDGLRIRHQRLAEDVLVALAEHPVPRVGAEHEEDARRLGIDLDREQVGPVAGQRGRQLVDIAGLVIRVAIRGGLVDVAGEHVVQGDDAPPIGVPLDVHEVAQGVLE